MGQVGQMRGRLKFTKLPPTSKLDRLLVSFGWGKWGRRGRHLKNFSEDTVTPYSDTGAGTTLHPAPDSKYCPPAFPSQHVTGGRK